MAKIDGGGEADFLRELRESRSPSKAKSGAHHAPGMVLHKPPVGRGKSLDEMLANQQQSLPASSSQDFTGGDDFIGLNNNGPSGQPRKLPLFLLDDSPYQPRLHYDDVFILELLGSMQTAGLDNPIKARPKGDRFEIIAGHRRIRAARLGGWTEIDAFVVDFDDVEAEIAALISNEGGQSLTDFERALMYQRAIDRGIADSQIAVGRLFACSQPRVSQTLRMLLLPKSIQTILRDRPNLLNYRSAAEVVKLLEKYPNGEKEIIESVSKATEDNSEKDLRAWIEQAMARKRGRPKSQQPLSILSPTGTVAFRTKIHARQVVIDVLEGLDPASVREWLVEELKRRMKESGAQ